MGGPSLGSPRKNLQNYIRHSLWHLVWQACLSELLWWASFRLCSFPTQSRSLRTLDVVYTDQTDLAKIHTLQECRSSITKSRKRVDIMPVHAIMSVKALIIVTSFTISSSVLRLLSILATLSQVSLDHSATMDLLAQLHSVQVRWNQRL